VFEFRRANFHGNKGEPDYEERYHPGTGSRALTDKTTDQYRLKNIYRDNPGGSWLAHERKIAAEKHKAGRRNSGSVTAGIREVFLDADEAAAIPGYLDEHLRDLAQESKERGLVQSVIDNGFDIEKKPLIAVNYRGDPYVLEGNHRIAAARAAGLERVPVELRYFAGGEDYGPFRIERFKK
jgi:hypothetical protein